MKKKSIIIVLIIVFSFFLVSEVYGYCAGNGGPGGCRRNPSSCDIDCSSDDCNSARSRRGGCGGGDPPCSPGAWTDTGNIQCLDDKTQQVEKTRTICPSGTETQWFDVPCGAGWCYDDICNPGLRVDYIEVVGDDFCSAEPATVTCKPSAGDENNILAYVDRDGSGSYDVGEECMFWYWDQNTESAIYICETDIPNAGTNPNRVTVGCTIYDTNQIGPDLTDELDIGGQSCCDRYFNENMIIHYPFDAMMSNSITFDITTPDYSGNFLHGKITGMGPSNVVGGKINNAFSFGSGDQVVRQYSSLFDFSPGVAVQFWLKSTETNGNILGNADSNSGFRIGLSEGKIKFEIGLNSGFEEVVGEDIVNDNVFHHIAVSYSNKVMKIFVDGILDNYSVIGTGESIQNNNNDITIGINGLIDDVKIYTRGLTRTEIQSEACLFGDNCVDVETDCFDGFDDDGDSDIDCADRDCAYNPQCLCQNDPGCDWYSQCEDLDGNGIKDGPRSIPQDVCIAISAGNPVYVCDTSASCGAQCNSGETTADGFFCCDSLSDCSASQLCTMVQYACDPDTSKGCCDNTNGLDPSVNVHSSRGPSDFALACPPEDSGSCYNIPFPEETTSGYNEYCCGDDRNEYGITSQLRDTSGGVIASYGKNTACADNPTDCVDSAGIIRSIGYSVCYSKNQVITCSSNNDWLLEKDSMCQAGCSDCDYVRDGTINIADYDSITPNFCNPDIDSCTVNPVYDVNNDGKVDLADTNYCRQFDGDCTICSDGIISGNEECDFDDANEPIYSCPQKVCNNKFTQTRTGCLSDKCHCVYREECIPGSCGATSDYCNGLCGNGQIDPGENCGNCPDDAGCGLGKVCCGDYCADDIDDCISPPICNNNDICEAGESCNCSDCDYNQDGCAPGFVCDPETKKCTGDSCNVIEVAIWDNCGNEGCLDGDTISVNATYEGSCPDLMYVVVNSTSPYCSIGYE